ncbi:MAG: PASTA domain-containing protein [Oscillospiraceae bacterium]|nr:PASTA domain-containing protein [Oscillospiraceae bacterium]
MSKRSIKIILSILVCALCSVILLAGCDAAQREEGPGKKPQAPKTDPVETAAPEAAAESPEPVLLAAPAGSESLRGKTRDEVISELQGAGFFMIFPTVVDDLTSDSAMPDGTVESVTINGRDVFEAGEEFPPDAEIEIVYHIIPKSTVPISAADIQTMKCRELAALFTSAGFQNVSVQEVYDKDPDEMDSEYVNEVTVSKAAAFEKGDQLPFDSEIVVTGHFPYEKFTVRLHVDFVSNFLFSRYNVDLTVTGEEPETLAHGRGGVFEYRLREGDYTVGFANTGSPSVRGEAALSVSCDMDVYYRINCYHDRVAVTELSVDYH